MWALQATVFLAAINTITAAGQFGKAEFPKVPSALRQQGELLQGKRIGGPSAAARSDGKYKATSNGWMSHMYYKMDECGGAALYQYGYPLSTCFVLYDDDSNDDDADNETPIGSLIYSCDDGTALLSLSSSSSILILIRNARNCTAQILMYSLLN